MKNMRGSEADYVERFGRFWEASGATRTMGRIIGWLTICDPPHQSAADLVEALGVSTGSVSTLTRQLMDLQMLERVTFPGDRASYYQLRDDAWIAVMDRKFAGLRELADLAARGRELLPGERADRVDDLAAVTDSFLTEWPGLMARLRSRMADRGAAPVAG